MKSAAISPSGVSARDKGNRPLNQLHKEKIHRIFQEQAEERERLDSELNDALAAD